MSKKARVFLATGAVAIVGGLVTSSLISSCDTVCTTESRASVIVNVVDESGDPVGADSVRYTVVDEPAPRDSVGVPPTSGTAAECADEDCTEWVAGYETEGLFIVTAEVCGRTVQGRVNVELTEDGCHVETEHLVLEADTMNCERPRSVDLSELGLAFPVPKEGLDITAPEPQLCTREARPSTIVRMISGEGSNARPVTPYGVYYQIDGGQLFSGTCLDEECRQVAAGWEETGTFSIFGVYENQLYQASTVVGMTEDGCHVETHNVDIPVGLQLQGVHVDKGPFLTAAPRQCSYEARPSVILEIVDSESEVAGPVHAKSVWYEMKEVREPTRAMCIHEPCGTWIVGIEEVGVLDIYADVCGEIISTQVTVERSEDGCHAVTQYAKMVAPVGGCPK
jgi:hypothetical protein